MSLGRKILADERNKAAATNFKNYLEEIAEELHTNSVVKGFWLLNPDGKVDTASRNKGEMIALMHSELSEALEGIRKPHQDEHCPDYTSEEVEFADALIRILEYCFAYKLRIGDAMQAKHIYNTSRPFKHGKAF
jgi:hypothetical protein